MRPTGSTPQRSRVENAFVQAVQATLPAGSGDKPQPIVVAVSGGLDSVSLLHLCARYAGELNIAPIAAHLDHGIRGELGRRDAAFVRDLAGALGVPCELDERDVPAYAAANQLSIETAARQLRYAFLGSMARHAAARAVCVAHHADDQAETVLLRLIRGTGIAGLAAMRPASPLESAQELLLLRPLLSVTRAELSEYASHNQLSHMHDETNDSVDHTRNGIRHDLVPVLEKFNPGIRRVLVNLAESAAGDAAVVQDAANAMLDAVMRHGDVGEPGIDRAAWCKLAPHWQRAVLRAAIAREAALVDVRFAAIEEARHVLNSDAARARIDLTSGVWIAMEPDWFCIKHGAKIGASPTQ